MTRKLTDLERAAHLLLPALTRVLADMRAEMHEAQAHASKRLKPDAAEDWSWIARRNEERVVGAARIVAAVRDAARGVAIPTEPRNDEKSRDDEKR